jgi:hypothetical protein
MQTARLDASSATVPAARLEIQKACSPSAFTADQEALVVTGAELDALEELEPVSTEDEPLFESSADAEESESPDADESSDDDVSVPSAVLDVVSSDALPASVAVAVGAVA